MNTVIYTFGEMQAHQIMMMLRGYRDTDDPKRIRSDADFILLLAERIKAERASVPLGDL